MEGSPPAPAPEDKKKRLDLNASFDTATAMFALFLWLVFGFLSPHLINCDVQRFIANNGYARLLTGLAAFFFLFTFIDAGSAEATLATTAVKTLLVYALFIGFTKTKWYFAVPVLALLAASQVVRRVLETRIQRTSAGSPEVTVADLQRTARIVDVSINVVVVALVVVGMLHYMRLQRIEYGENFSLSKFFLQTNRHCKPYDPDYRAMPGYRGISSR